MPGDVTFRIEGAAEMAKLLKELGPRAARRAGTRSVRAGAKPIVDRAKELAPQPGKSEGYATGALRDAIAAEMVKRGIGAESVVIAIGWERPISRRGHLSEFGTAHSAAQSHIRPALDEEGQRALDEMGRVLGDGITREAERLAGIKGTRRRR